jgi:hypothetical protein
MYSLAIERHGGRRRYQADHHVFNCVAAWLLMMNHHPLEQLLVLVLEASDR